MNIDQINKDSIKKVSDKELLNIHYRIHQLYSVAKKRNNKPQMKLFEAKHTIVANQMIARGMKHKSPINTSLKKVRSMYNIKENITVIESINCWLTESLLSEKLIKSVVYKIVHEHIGVNKYKSNNQIKDNLNLKKDLYMDDEDKLEVLMKVEEFFLINLPDREIKKWNVVKDIIKTITSKKINKEKWEKEKKKNKKEYSDVLQYGPYDKDTF